MLTALYVLVKFLHFLCFWMKTSQESSDLQDSSGATPYYRFHQNTKTSPYLLSLQFIWPICLFPFHFPIFIFILNFSLFGVGCPPRGTLAQLLTLSLATFSVFLAARTMLGPIAGPGGTVFALLVLIVLALLGA